MTTWLLKLEGRIQGVGFRPFVYNLAKSLGINGFIRNEISSVTIVFNSAKNTAEQFQAIIHEKAPRHAIILTSALIQTTSEIFTDFEIQHSSPGDALIPTITPDFAICEDCMIEVFNREDRRFGYPFLSCTNCGARYAIIERLPYDRLNTKLAGFEMCTNCQTEYENPNNRRFHAQTNSCHQCGIPIKLQSRQSQWSDGATIVKMVNDAWSKGKIVAIKGIGGYLVTCDATNEHAIEKLRVKKQRPAKPFALMYRNIKQLRDDYHLNPLEQKILTAATAPIVLLQRCSKNQLPLNIAPNNDRIGIMLAYTPLHHLLLKNYPNPTIATSANIHKAPIIYQDDKKEKLFELADLILEHALEIVTPQDDSVVRITALTNSKIFLRRSRGYAPSLFIPDLVLRKAKLLAFGAMLKSTFAVQKEGALYLSQYLGDTSDYDTQENYQRVLSHLLNVVDHTPDVVLCDQHTDYPTTHIARSMAKKLDCPLISVQHHRAHFAAILGEHALLQSDRPVLGIIWDGLGLGDDGHIWGGEFFVYSKIGMPRVFHLDYYPSIVQERMAKEPRVAALAVFHEIDPALQILQRKFSKIEFDLLQQVLKKKDGLQSSSMGRIFDAVASILGLIDKQTFEGEAAILLEQAAALHLAENGLENLKSYSVGTTDMVIHSKEIFEGIIKDLLAGTSIAQIAAKFHFTLVKIIEMVAEKLQTRKLACSGGVFQNAVLVDLIKIHLGKKHQLYFHQKISPNDENISFGQLMYYHLRVPPKTVHGLSKISDKIF